MKGVILAGGYGTRLRPLTYIVNKHLLPVYDRPMVLYPLETLVKSGVKDVLVVSEEAQLPQFQKFLKTGEGYGANISYAAQKGAGGISAALALAEQFSGGDSVAVILGDNIFEDEFSADLKLFGKGAMAFLKEVPDLHRFGVPVFEEGELVRVEEKPKEPKSKFAAVGLYLFDRDVFDAVKELKPSARGELEITDALNAYAARGALRHAIVKGYWKDVGTFDSLLEAAAWAARRRR